jgi:GAF domain-containing protein/HAMP domain-containing protein
MSPDYPNNRSDQIEVDNLQSLKNRKFTRLSTRLSLSFALFAILLVGIITYTNYQNTRSQLHEDIRARLRDAVAIGAQQIDGDKHALLTEPAQEGSATYMQIKKVLQGIRDAGTGIRFVYTMRQDEQGNIIFIVDAEESEADISHLGDIYDDASDLIKDNFSSLYQPIVEEEFYTDKWGTWLTGYAPFYTSNGQREGVVGMDISASNVIARERQALWNALTIFLASIPPIFVIGWFLGSRLAKPISSLSEAAKKIAAGNLSVRIKTGSTNQEVYTLENSFNMMTSRLQELVENLEKRVSERTQELTVATEYARLRALQFETIAQLSQIITSIQNPETLLTKITELISQRMGYYHAGIFLLDNNREYAVLQAANSSGGQRMLQRKHKLKVGEQGIVGFVTSTGTPRIALDVGDDAVFFDNPDLPETRSEMALPLTIAGEIIGALDLQSTEPNAFSNEDIEVLAVLANQVAISIRNAYSFEQTRLAIQRAELALQQQAKDNWRQFSRSQSVRGYSYDGINPRSLDHASEEKTDNTFEIPVQLHGQVIGKIRLNPNDSARIWSDDEIAIVQAAVERAALTLENARLLNEAQQRASRERIIGDISASISTFSDLEGILRTAVQQLGRRMGGAEVVLELGSNLETKEIAK